MSTPSVAPAPAAETPLSQWSRLLNVFIAPSATFRDLNRSAAFWLPYLVIAIMQLGAVYTIDKKVGFDQVAANMMEAGPMAQRLERATPEQREAIQRRITNQLRFSYFGPVMLIVWFLIVSLVLMATFNFGLGAKLPFKRVMALVVYASVPSVVASTILMVASLMAGADTSAFNIENPIATNLGYILNPESPALNRLASSFDVLIFWTIALMGLGISCLSRVKAGTAIAVLGGWWLFITLVRAGFAVLVGSLG